MTKTGLYEQIKDDLGYLGFVRAGEVFATLADDARKHRWSHIEYLARLLAEEATSTRDRRLAARLRYAKFPFHKTIQDFDFEFQPTVDRKLIPVTPSRRCPARPGPGPVERCDEDLGPCSLDD